MAMDTGNNDSMVSEINVTPLVDVMLVLLTIFIVTAPLLTNAVSVKLPKADSSLASTHSDSLRIGITPAGGLLLDNTPLTRPELEIRLKRAATNQQGVEILADEKVDYGAVARVMAMVQRSGIHKFSFVMLPESAR